MEEAIKCLDINTNAFLLLNSSSRWLGIVLVREFLKLFHSTRSIFTINTFQDYLGAIIVSSAIFVMLISAKLYPHITPALVGLAINYTLLVPIYLNWVVKFIAETEIYFGSVARISTYRYAPVENYQDGTLSLKYKF